MNMIDETPRRTVTKGDIAERGIEAFAPGEFKSGMMHRPSLGNISYVDLPHVIELAKLMSTGGEGVPEHCRANPGLCLRICFQAVEWEMTPYAVADGLEVPVSIKIAVGTRPGP